MASTQPVRVPERRSEPSETPAASAASHSVPTPRKQPFTIVEKVVLWPIDEAQVLYAQVRRKSKRMPPIGIRHYRSGRHPHAQCRHPMANLRGPRKPSARRRRFRRS